MAALKFSRQREIIRNHLMSRCDHPTAEMIYTSLKENDPKLSLGTVYRNLGLLVELGQIGKLPTENGPDRYDGNTAGHGHFICRKCGGIWDVPQGEITRQIKDVIRSDSRSAETVAITVTGLCPDCLKDEAGNKDPET